MNKDSKIHNKTKSNINETPHKSHHRKKKENTYFYSASKKTNQRRSSLLIQTIPNLTEDKSKNRNIKRNSLYKEPYKNPRNQINTIFKDFHCLDLYLYLIYMKKFRYRYINVNNFHKSVKK